MVREEKSPRGMANGSLNLAYGTLNLAYGTLNPELSTIPSLICSTGHRILTTTSKKRLPQSHRGSVDFSGEDTQGMSKSHFDTSRRGTCLLAMELQPLANRHQSVR